MNREKVIKGLEEISDYFFNVYHRSKDREEINNAKDRCDSIEDALALLKEKEAVEPLTEFFIGKDYQPTCKACGFRPFVYIPTLEWMKERGFNFCPRCGKKVKWDADGA